MAGKKSPFEGFDLAGQVTTSQPLDQQLFTTRRPRVAQPESAEAIAPPLSHETPANTETGKQGNNEARLPVSGETRKEGNKVLPALQKATFALPAADVDALDDIKRLLRREHGIKVTKERIVAEAIRHFYHDLEENKKTSFLVKKLSKGEGAA